MKSYMQSDPKRRSAFDTKDTIFSDGGRLGQAPCVSEFSTSMSCLKTAGGKLCPTHLATTGDMGVS